MVRRAIELTYSFAKYRMSKAPVEDCKVSMTQQLRICIDRIVPYHLEPWAKAQQRRPLGAARMAPLAVKKWENLQILRCRFLDGSAHQRSMVMDKARIWQDYAGISIVFVGDPDAEVRISFCADSFSWSAIGRDCLNADYYLPGQPTMNFGWLRDDTPELEYQRTVLHEFGHALGCIHEHQSPDEQLKWNVEAVYRAFSGSPNFWSKEEIENNVLRRYSSEGIRVSRYDPASIMLYQFDGALFLDGVGTPYNSELSGGDKAWIGFMYPRQPPMDGNPM